MHEWSGLRREACLEFYLELVKLGGVSAFVARGIAEAEQMRALQAGARAQPKPQHRLAVSVYCCYTVRKLAADLDGYVRAKPPPATRRYFTLVICAGLLKIPEAVKA